MLGAVGNLSPPSPSASSPELPIDVRPPGLGLQLVRPFCKSFSSSLMLRITLWSNSSNSSLVLRLRPSCLLKNFHACSCFSWRGCTSSARACQRSRYRRRAPGLMFTSSWRFWASSLPVVLTSKFRALSAMVFRFHVSRGGSWSSSTEPSSESQGELLCKDTAVRLRRSTGRGPAFTCGRTSTSGPWILHHCGLEVWATPI